MNQEFGMRNLEFVITLPRTAGYAFQIPTS
jgi:hypothetical protein